MSKFGSMSEAGRLRDAQGGFLEATLLPDSEKERLCRSLLAEFGVTSVHSNDKGELIHSCCLPYGLHAHGDKNPSASLNYKMLTYNCYACGGGGLLWFIGECRGGGSLDARRWLESETGTGPDEQPLGSLLEFFDAVYAGADKAAAKPLPRYDIRVIEPWLAIHPYMTEIRKIPEETLKRFRVGYGALRMNIGTPDEPVWIDSHRIVIPHFWRGDLVGWQSRRLLEDGTPRYKSTSEFPKDVTLFNYVTSERAIVAESPMSVLRHADRHPIVATFGAEVTDRQIRHLSKYGRVTLWFDNDNAGWRATAAVGEALEAYCPVFVVPSEYAADPADFAPDEFDALLAEAIPFSVWRPPMSLRPLEAA